MSMGLACSLTRLFCVETCGANAAAAPRQRETSNRCMIRFGAVAVAKMRRIYRFCERRQAVVLGRAAVLAQEHSFLRTATDRQGGLDNEKQPRVFLSRGREDKANTKRNIPRRGPKIGVHEQRTTFSSMTKQVGTDSSAVAGLGEAI